jgi:hypothetical protein
MSTTLRFRDHEVFHQTAIDLAIAGGLAGLVAFIAAVALPGFGSVTAPWGVAVLAAAAMFAVSPRATRTRIPNLIMVGFLAAFVGLALRLTMAPRPEALGVVALVAAFGALAARGSRRPVLTFVAAAGTALIMRYVHVSLVAAGTEAQLPVWLSAAFGGAAFAFVGILGTLPRHVDLGENRVDGAYAATREASSGEIRELTDRGMAVWTRVEPTLEHDSAVRRAFEDSVVRLFDVARRWTSVESEGGRTPVEQLVERMDQIEGKIARTEDAIAKGQYQQAHAALAEQLRYLREIGTARERVVARMHHYLAAMERLRMAVLNHRSADASRLSTEVQPILDDLKDLGREIDFSSEAMGEVEKDQAAPRAQA